MGKISSGLAKLLNRLQFASKEDCRLDKTVKVGARSVLQSVCVGRHSYFGHDCTAVNADIGAFCSIASFTVLGGGEHPLNWISTSPRMFTQKQKDRYQNPKHFPKVTLGNDVWLGEGVFVKCGVTVGTGAVIGAHSVVTEDIPPYAVAVGAPAKVIRDRFDEETKNLLLSSQWWNWSEGERKDFLKQAEASEDFVSYLKNK